MMKVDFSMIKGIVPMNLPVFLIWGLWDTLLTLFVTLFIFLYLREFGPSLKHTLWAGITVWAGIFVILWLGCYNMGLGSLHILSIALPLSLLEMVVASFIVRHIAKIKKTKRLDS